MAKVTRIAALAASLCLVGIVFADDKRAEINYMLHCQGCHLPAATGFPGRVPPMKNFVGYFLYSQPGREFLIRVPGVAHSALDNSEVAELMNWLVTTYSAEQLPQTFVPFTATEVAALRDNAERDPESNRTIILANIAAAEPALAGILKRAREQ